MKGLLEIVSSAAEFEDMPIRQHEDVVLRRIYDRVPHKLDRINLASPYHKVFVLLQAHFARLQLPADLASDQKLILAKVLNLLSACVDVTSSNAYLSTALVAMELSQMCVQAVWSDRDSPLRQVPHFTPEVIERCKVSSLLLRVYLASMLTLPSLCRPVEASMTSLRLPTYCPIWTTRSATSCCAWTSVNLPT